MTKSRSRDPVSGIADVHSPQFQALLAAAPDAILVIDREGRVVQGNEQAALLFRCTQPELAARPIEALLPPRHRTPHRAHPRDHFASPSRRQIGETTEMEATGRRHDGSEFPAEVSLGPIETADGPMVIAIVRDGTSRRLAEVRLRRVLEAAPDATIMSDARGRIVLVSTQAEKLFGYERAELLGKSVEILVPARFRGIHLEHRRGYFREPRSRPMGGAGVALYAQRKDGSEFPAEISLNPLETDEGMMAITAIRDVSERKRLDEERTKLTQAEEAVRLRDEFLSIASHELKTPLTALSMQVEYLVRLARKWNGGAATGKLQTGLMALQRIVQRFIGLVDQLLDVSRLTAGRLQLEREPTDLGEVIRRVLDQFHSELTRAGCALQTDIAADVRGNWDPLRLEQIVSNLVSNACKYGRGEPIEVRLTATQPGIAVLTVRDHGIGIHPEHQARIFERFERNVTGRTIVGFGLGLWIARQMVEAHGGRIGVESAPGDGATFTVELPCD